MKELKKKIGPILHKGNEYNIYWDSKTKLVYYKDEMDVFTNFCDAKAVSEDKVLECAVKMLELSGF